MHINLAGQIALVTGSNGGIGRAIAERLAASGAMVAVHYNSNKEQGEQTVSLIHGAGGKAALFQANLTDIKQIEHMMIHINREFGGTVDILVNNAGHLVKRVLNLDMTEEHYNRVMDVNFKSCVFMCKAVAEGMKVKGKGKIVNVTSVAAHNGGGPGSSIYAAGKAAMLAYSKGLAKELANSQILVNAVSPGFIGQTAFHDTFTPDEARKSTINGIPLGREGTPEDVANAVLFLASAMSDYLTGESIEVNGGMFMR